MCRLWLTDKTALAEQDCGQRLAQRSPQDQASSTDTVTICTVVAARHLPLLAANRDLIGRLNPGQAVRWRVVFNPTLHDPPQSRRAPRAGENGSADAGPATIRDLIPGVEVLAGPDPKATHDRVMTALGSRGDEASEHRRLLDKFLGSYHHAESLGLALEGADTRFVIIMDPDFYVIRRGWIGDILGHMKDRDLALFGAPWSPRWRQKVRYVAAPHLMVIDREKCPLHRDILAPDLIAGGRRFGSALWSEFAAAGPDARRSALVRILRRPIRAIGEDLRQRSEIGSARDTGHGLAQAFAQNPALTMELCQPVFSPGRDGFMPPDVTPLQANRLVESLLPDRLSYIPKRRGYVSRSGFAERGLPDFRGLGWEEFLWRDAPFAFHIRGELNRSSEHSADGDLRHGLDSILHGLQL